MKKFQNGRGWGNPEKSFMYHAWGRSTERIDRWEKQNERLVVVSCSADGAFAVHFTEETAARHSHFTFSQMCLSFLITVVSVFEGWSHWICLCDREAAIARCKWCFFVFSCPAPSGLCGAQTVFECLWLLSSAHQPLLTGICDESLLNYREKGLHFHKPASHSPAEMKYFFWSVWRKCSYLCTMLTPFKKKYIFTISGCSTYVLNNSSFPVLSPVVTFLAAIISRVLSKFAPPNVPWSFP